MTPTYTEERVRLFRERFCYDESPSKLMYHLIQNPTELAEEIEEFLKESIAGAKVEERDDLIDDIEGNCEFVKEDVPDGNFGYYKVYTTDLERLARTPEQTDTLTTDV